MEDAPGMPVQAGEASERVSHGFLRVSITCRVFLSTVVRPGDVQARLGSARSWPEHRIPQDHWLLLLLADELMFAQHFGAMKCCVCANGCSNCQLDGIAAC